MVSPSGLDLDAVTGVHCLPDYMRRSVNPSVSEFLASSHGRRGSGGGISASSSRNKHGVGSVLGLDSRAAAVIADNHSASTSPIAQPMPATSKATAANEEAEDAAALVVGGVITPAPRLGAIMEVEEEQEARCSVCAISGTPSTSSQPALLDVEASGGDESEWWPFQALDVEAIPSDLVSLERVASRLTENVERVPSSQMRDAELWGRGTLRRRVGVSKLRLSAIKCVARRLKQQKDKVWDAEKRSGRKGRELQAYIVKVAQLVDRLEVARKRLEKRDAEADTLTPSGSATSKKNKRGRQSSTAAPASASPVIRRRRIPSP
ncbi:unnamed protein product [Amoebophrya sp. A25]|nr:unnamed protein product [Amoebophrya sp. A25]|eukprot:GSA25T00027828001.1